MGKAKIARKKLGRLPKQYQSKLNIDVKVGILHTIADAIYSTPAGKIREAVANAMDREATWMIIIIDQATKSLFLFDNGTGITEKRFHEIFESIGYGLLKNKPDKKLSFFGLGLMSIFQLGKKVKLFTQPRGENQIYKLEVDTDAIFSKNNEDKSISSLHSFVSLHKTKDSERMAASVPLLNQSLGKIQFKNSLKSFTEIIIEGIQDDDFNVICDDSFVEELRKILPLKPEKDEPFLKRFTGDKVKDIKKIVQNEEFCKTIDIYLGVQEDNSLEPLCKYFPAFRADMSFPDDNIYVGQSQDKDFAYYIVHSVAVDLHRSLEAERESGFWVRNQNFLVKSADFLERPGPGRKIKTIDQPLQGWIFGEIFHKDMNPFLAVSRTEFLFEKEGFKKFQRQLTDIVSPLNQELREIYEKKRKIVDGLVEPFSKLSAKDGTIVKTEQRLREMISPELDEKTAREKIFAQLKKIRCEEIESEHLHLDNILKQKRPITLGEDKDALVKIDPTLKGKGQDFNVTWDAQNNRVMVSISPDLFEPKQITFLGKTFTMYFVAAGKKDPGASIDVEHWNIYINPFNEDLTRYSVSVFDVYLALQIADAISNNKKELVKNTLVLLGVSSPISQKYITPLGDDLRRTVQISGVRAKK